MTKNVKRKRKKNMWQGKYKAFTLSFDDGIEQDAKLIALLESYGLKATFNLNTGLAGRTESFVCNRRFAA